MSRIPELALDKLTPAQREVHDEIVSGPHGRIVGPFPAWLNSPELARRVRAVSEFIRFQATLPNRLSELAILITGRYWTAEFEFWAHSRLGKQAGLSQEQIDALAQRRRPAFADGDEEVVYDFCTELYEQHRVSDATYARGVEALGLQAVVELVATIGYYSMVCMTLNAFEVGLPPGERSPFPD